jgi:hypothetical protein
VIASSSILFYERANGRPGNGRFPDGGWRLVIVAMVRPPTLAERKRYYILTIIAQTWRQRRNRMLFFGRAGDLRRAEDGTDSCRGDFFEWIQAEVIDPRQQAAPRHVCSSISERHSPLTRCKPFDLNERIQGEPDGGSRLVPIAQCGGIIPWLSKSRHIQLLLVRGMRADDRSSRHPQSRAAAGDILRLSGLDRR